MTTQTETPKALIGAVLKAHGEIERAEKRVKDAEQAAADARQAFEDQAMKLINADFPEELSQVLRGAGVQWYDDRVLTIRDQGDYKHASASSCVFINTPPQPLLSFELDKFSTDGQEVA